MIPLFLDLSASTVSSCFGAGSVGIRKAHHFTSVARMTIVAEDLSPEVFAFKNASIKQQAIEDMEIEDLEKLIGRHDIVIAALSDEKENERLCSLAKAAGKLYNNATGEGNIRIPSVVFGAEYQIAVTTEKSAPAVPAFYPVLSGGKPSLGGQHGASPEYASRRAENDDPRPGTEGRDPPGRDRQYGDTKRLYIRRSLNRNL